MKRDKEEIHSTSLTSFANQSCTAPLQSYEFACNLALGVDRSIPITYVALDEVDGDDRMSIIVLGSRWTEIFPGPVRPADYIYMASPEHTSMRVLALCAEVLGECDPCFGKYFRRGRGQ